MAAASRPANDTTISADAHDPSSRPSTSEYRPGPSNEKKRKANGTAASSRGVANLTPEQLAKKRANDREAQRAIRERTKNQIETLEKRIKELTSQQPYQELQHVLRQKELVEIENADIKRRLASVLELIQPIVGNSGLGDNVRSAAQSGGAPSAPRNSVSYGQSQSPVQYPPVNNAEPMNRRTSVDSWNHTLALTQASIQPASRLSSQADRSSPAERKGRASSSNETVASMFRTTSAERQALGLFPSGRSEIQSGAHLVDKQGPSPVPSPSLHSEHSHITNLSGPGQRLAHTPPSNYDQPSPRPAFMTLPRNCGPSCTLDSLILDFVSERRARLSDGLPPTEVLGPPYPSFAAILYPERRLPCHPMSAFFRDILSTFPDIAAPPEKVAVSYVMFLIMRWHCHATSENFERLPQWAKPTSWQVTMPHPIWIDHLPWPEMRNEAVKNQQRYPFDNFFIPYTGTLSLNWGYADTEVFTKGPGDGVGVGASGEELVMSMAFEAHCLRLDNWSLGPAFAHEYPMLVASVRMEDRRRRRSEGK